MAAKAMVPKLRFKEFKNQWVSNKLEALVDSIQSGKSKHRTEDGKFPLFGSTGAIGMTNATEYSGIAILIARVGANAGSKYLVDGNYSVTDNTLILRLKSSNDYDFFSNLLEYKKLNKLTFGSGQPLVTGGLLKQLEIKSPDLIEQTKIAKFLTAVDTKISQLTKKYELLSSYKKGVMQKIFNQELRFKDDDGREFPEWSQVSFADIANINMGQSPESSTYNQDSLGLPLIQGNADIVNRKTSPRAWTSEPTKKCNPGDLIFTVRAPVGAIAKSSHTACIGRGVCAITPKENVCIEFLYQLLFWFESYKWKSIEQGSTFTAVSGDDIRNLKVMSPIFKEQTKIANFLNAIDDKITNAKSQLEAAKQYKQGLLQQMFV
jgi:type I restriction enzyme S subunit